MEALLIGGPILAGLLAYAALRSGNKAKEEERKAEEARAKRVADAHALHLEEERKREALELEERKLKKEIEELRIKHENERRAFELEHEKVLLGDEGVRTEMAITQIGSYRSVRMKQVPKAKVDAEVELAKGVVANQELSVALCKETTLKAGDVTLRTGRGAVHVRADAEVELAKNTGRHGFYKAMGKVAEASAKEERERPIVVVRKDGDEKAEPTLRDRMEATRKELDEAKAEKEKLRKELDEAKAKKEAAGKDAGEKKDGGKEAPKKDEEKKEGESAGRGGRR